MVHDPVHVLVRVPGGDARVSSAGGYSRISPDDAVYYAYWVPKAEYKVSIDKDEVILSADPQAPNNKYQIKANVMPVDGTIAEFISSNSET